MTEDQNSMIRDLYFRKAYWWKGRPLKELSEKKRGEAIDRLNAIPSELEVMKYLFDTGKILYIEKADHVYLVNWWDYYESIDVRFVEAERPDKTKVYLAGVDAKNVGVWMGKDRPEYNLYHGGDYPNVYIETQKKRGDEYQFDGWATSFYKDVDGEPVRNRYIAYVRNGKAFDGKLATETEAFSLDRSEAENKREIVQYYAQHLDQLTHDIMFVYCDDVAEYIDRSGGTDPNRRRKDRLQSNAPDTKAALVNFSEWDQDHARVMISWDQERKQWKEPEQCGKKTLDLKAIPWTATRDTAKAEAWIQDLYIDQAVFCGLDTELILKLFGIPEKLLTEEEIIEQWKARWDYDARSAEDQPDYTRVFRSV